MSSVRGFERMYVCMYVCMYDVVVRIVYRSFVVFFVSTTHVYVRSRVNVTGGRYVPNLTDTPTKKHTTHIVGVSLLSLCLSLSLCVCVFLVSWRTCRQPPPYVQKKILLASDFLAPPLSYWTTLVVCCNRERQKERERERERERNSDCLRLRSLYSYVGVRF